jgi:hypothetical protein
MTARVPAVLALEKRSIRSSRQLGTPVPISVTP